MERAAACRELSLDPEQPIVLVFGGSRGARALNQTLSRDLEALLSLAQVVHISGEQEHASVARQTRSLPASAQRRYRGFDYLHRMELALAAADVAVCRAGASTLGEMPLFGLPAILVPYPHAGPNQSVNAQWLVERDAALMIEESDLSVQLLPTLTRLLTDPNTMRQMQAHMRALARPGAAQALADELLDLACSHLERGP
jgi:UDP-N-acetylglucosamine--N-acetylmuramyl-(pentapeptide) pyrophosphoryl-undecaprenol N-acetylglucosamine transferase